MPCIPQLEWPEHLCGQAEDTMRQRHSQAGRSGEIERSAPSGAVRFCGSSFSSGPPLWELMVHFGTDRDAVVASRSPDTRT